MKFIIYCPDYDENSGGSIALHRLCDLINKAGYEGYVYPIDWLYLQDSFLKKIKYICKKIIYKITRKKIKTNPKFTTPVATRINIDNSIVIYPEIIKNNPLGASNIVRWILYKIPPDDILLRNSSDHFFFFQKAFEPATKCIINAGLLQTIHLLDDIYINHHKDREGTCHLIRKGQEIEFHHNIKSSKKIDGLSHKEISEIFNTSEVFISYDGYTMYSNYAAMCGCLSVVVPRAGIDKISWQPDENLRLGIAYGLEDIQWAKKTMHQVKPYFQTQQNEKNKSVLEFIKYCKNNFPIK